MHIAEGFLPPVHAIGWTVVAAPFDDLLARARLGRPWALTVGSRLRELGLLPDGPLPRDVGDLLAALPERPGVPT